MSNAQGTRPRRPGPPLDNEVRRALLLATLAVLTTALPLAAQTPSEPGWTASTFAAGLLGPANGLVWDCQRGGALVTDHKGDRVVFVDGVASPVLFATMTTPDELVVDWQRNRIAVKQHAIGGPIRFFALNGAPLGSFGVGGFPLGIAFDGAGDFYSVVTFPAQIWRYSEAKLPPQTPSPSLFATTPVVEAIRFAPDGRLFAAAFDTGEILEIVAPSGPHVVWASGLVNPFGLAFDPCTGDILATAADRIVRIRAPNVVSDFATGLASPTAVEFDEQGNLYVTEYTGGRVTRFTTPKPCPLVVVANAGDDATTCTDPVLLDGSRSNGCGALPRRYRWLAGSTEVCGWSAIATCMVRPTATTTYTLDIACDTRCSPGSSDTVTVTIEGPAANLKPIAPLCDVEHPITLDASLSATAGCSKPLEFQFRDGATVLQAWSTSPTYGPFLPLPRIYTVDVRCPGLLCVSSASVDVTFDPDLVPPSLGNTLRSVRKSADVVMIWGSAPEARSFSLYRDVAKGVWPPAALRSQLAGPLDTEPDVPPPPPLYFYRAVGASCSGREGP